MDTQPLPNVRVTDPRGGFTSNPVFSIDANMDGPFMRDGSTNKLSDPLWPVNGDC